MTHTGSNPPPPPPPPPPSPDGEAHELVDRLADGTLDAGGHSRLGRAMERDGSLERDARELQRVNDRLKAFFTTPITDIPAMPQTATKSLFTRRAAIGLLAACLVIGGVVIGLAIGLEGGPTGWAREARDLYRSIAAANFKPTWECTTAEEFAGWTSQNIGEALTPQLGVPGLELVGWNKSQTFSPYTGVLIAKVEGRGVIVLLDRAALVQSEGVRELGEGLKAFPGMIGSVGVVEVTPLDSPRVIGTIMPAGK